MSIVSRKIVVVKRKGPMYIQFILTGIPGITKRFFVENERSFLIKLPRVSTLLVNELVSHKYL